MVLSVYLPTFLFSVGQGAIMPVIPLFALDLGASVAMAGFVVGLRGLGLMLCDVPSGVIVSRFGDKGAMVVGTAMVAVAAIGASMSRSVFVLAAISFVMGGGWAFWGLARFAYITEIVPVQHRGRAMSLVGGANRVGNFVGPVVGGYLGKHFGLESTFYAQAVMGLAASVLVFVVVRDSSGSEDLGGHGIGGRLLASVAEHRRVLLTAGLAVVALQILRQGRTVFLPLWGDRIGLDVAQIGVVVGIASFIDAGLFYPAGYLMDRIGRKWASVPSLLLMSLGFLALPATRELYGFALIAMVIGLGNGFGMGINMTLGADFAPAERRAEFLGVWRFISDAGGAAGPFAVSLVTGVAGLGSASIICALFGFAGTVVMWRLVPETLRRARQRRPSRLAAPPG
jgi:MFS family permease